MDPIPCVQRMEGRWPCRCSTRNLTDSEGKPEYSGTSDLCMAGQTCWQTAAAAGALRQPVDMLPAQTCRGYGG